MEGRRKGEIVRDGAILVADQNIVAGRKVVGNVRVVDLEVEEVNV